MARRTGGRVFGASSRRLTQWIGPADQGYIAVANAQSVLISSFTPDSASNMVRPTIVRTRGQIALKLPDYSADANVVGAVGCAVVTTDAFTAGAVLIP